MYFIYIYIYIYVRVCIHIHRTSSERFVEVEPDGRKRLAQSPRSRCIHLREQALEQCSGYTLRDKTMLG